MASPRDRAASIATARFSLTLLCPINSLSRCGRSFSSNEESSSTAAADTNRSRLDSSRLEPRSRLFRAVATGRILPRTAWRQPPRLSDLRPNAQMARPRSKAVLPPRLSPPTSEPAARRFSAIAFCRRSIWSSRSAAAISLSYFGYHSSNRTSIPVPSNPFLNTARSEPR